MAATANDLILVTGATGRLGRHITAGLRAQKARFRVLTRTPDARSSFAANGIEAFIGDFTQPTSLIPALQGVSRVFLLSPITETLERDQKALIDAAAKAGVTRIVKLSGSDWTVGTSASGDMHAAVEAHLTALPEHVAIRPNAWTQVSLAPVIASLKAGGDVPARHEAAVSYIDIEDIAAVALNQLLAARPAQGPLVITGPEALTYRQIADIATILTGRAVGLGPPAAAPAHQGFEAGVVRQFYKVIAAGGAAGITRVVEEITGRPSLKLQDMLARELAKLPA